ncbi:unnamed protein product [Rotaria sp. Silwood2]|nr:unnamed protein product [Rotaria sp. Silwood2]CAF2592710.1 unnamed protein product [Rotaria sp. Silwood2]CAF2833125.1 unnamed protein product [Rotaria sp. Silwood2]CAF2977184.1 unnamed protein product [Rotaria sp. Silwood2]CAF3872523.1 unnamed protein product [Rotaria sp. Silwood2]
MDMKLKVILAILLVLKISQVYTQEAGDSAVNVNAANANLISKRAASTCGGNCLSMNCPSCPCGRNRNIQNPAVVCRRYNGWSQSCCRCIIKMTSNGNANAVRYYKVGVRKNTYDVGLFGIHESQWHSCNNGTAPCGVTQNLNCAEAVWKAKSHFSQWTAFAACRKQKQC